MKYLKLLSILLLAGLVGCSSSSSQSGSVSKASALLAYNRLKSDITETPSGLQYKVLLESKRSCKPTHNATINVHYDMRIAISNVSVDNSFARGEPTEFKLGQMIPAWKEALPMMNVGEVWELYIPADLAYGQKGIKGSIPPNTVLISKVALLSTNNCK